MEEAIHRGTGFKDEIEKGAQAFEQRDFPLAALCLRKALKGVEPPRQHPDASPDARDTSVFAEARRALDAIESQDFTLAAVCLRKVAAGFPPPSPEAARAMEELIRSLDDQDFTGTAQYLRDLGALVK